MYLIVFSPILNKFYTVLRKLISISYKTDLIVVRDNEFDRVPRKLLP